MASGNGFSNAGFGFGVGAPSASKSKKKKHSRPGLGGLIENLGSDVRDTVVGIPTGLIKLVKDPVESVEAMGKSTWHTWSPLFKGDFGEFGHQLYAHPLAPILDVASVFTMGAGTAARGASALSATGKISKTSKLGKMAERRANPSRELAGPTVGKFKHYSKNPLIRRRQEMNEKLSDRLGSHMPQWFGEGARYRKADARDIAGRRAAMQTSVAAFVKNAVDMNDHATIRKVLENTYDQTKRFSIWHDATKPLPEGYAYLRARNKTNRGYFFDPRVKRQKGVTGHMNMEEELLRFGNRYTTKDAKAGLYNQGASKVMIVPKHTVKKFGIEGAQSSKFMRALYTKPTDVWKSIILGYSPRYFVNNAVGNNFMYLMSAGGPGAMRAYVDALRQVKSEKSVQKMLGDVDGEIANKMTYQNKYYADQLNNTMGYTNLERLLDPKDTKFKGIARKGFFGVTHTWADQVIRRAYLIKLNREIPEVKAMVKKGMKEEDAIEQFLSKDLRDNNGMVRSRISNEVDNALGDYHTLNEVERKVRQVVPFYAWDRHIVRHVKNLGDKPIRLSLMAKMGAEGAEETERVLGEIPKFLKGAIPLSLLGMKSDSKGRTGVLTTQGLNPYASIAELFDVAKAATVGGPQRAGESIGGQINPLLQGAIEGLTKRSLLSGTPVEPKGGLLVSPYVRAVENLPQFNLVEAAVKGKAKQRPGHPTLYEKDLSDQIWAILGVPVKNVSKQSAKNLSRRED